MFWMFCVLQDIFYVRNDILYSQKNITILIFSFQGSLRPFIPACQSTPPLGCTLADPQQRLRPVTKNDPGFLTYLPAFLSDTRLFHPYCPLIFSVPWQHIFPALSHFHSASQYQSSWLP